MSRSPALSPPGAEAEIANLFAIPYTHVENIDDDNDIDMPDLVVTIPPQPSSSPNHQHHEPQQPSSLAPLPPTPPESKLTPEEYQPEEEYPIKNARERQTQVIGKDGRVVTLQFQPWVCNCCGKINRGSMFCLYSKVGG